MNDRPVAAKIRQLAELTWQQIWDHSLPSRASSVAFSSMFAAVPLLFLVSYLAAHLLPNLSAANGVGIGNLTADQLHAALKAFFPEMVYNVVDTVLVSMQYGMPTSIISGTLVIAIWSSSGAFCEIIDCVNRIYGVQETRSFLKLRLTAFFIALIQSVIIIVSLGIIIMSPHFLEWLHLKAQHAWAISILQWTLLYIMLIFSYALTFRVGCALPGKSMWLSPGASIGALIFLLSSWIFRVYIQTFANYSLWYGQLAGVMALMFWFYLISWVLLAAAQINRIVMEATKKE